LGRSEEGGGPLADEYLEVAFGDGTGWKTKVNTTPRRQYSYTDSHGDLRRKPGERDAGRAQSRAAAAEVWLRAQSESARRKLPSRIVPYIRHFNLFRRHMPRAKERDVIRPN